MPDKRAHRGPHPEDHVSFGAAAVPDLAEAISDLSWLWTRGYTPKASVKLVGDRFSLSERQRIAIQRCACSDASLRRRRERDRTLAETAGRALWIDGFNVITTVEAALAGGVVLVGRDGCCRDMASIHGHYKRVEETLPSIALIGDTLARAGVGEVAWFLDRPVSNSGRLAEWLRTTASARGWNWHVELVQNPDTVLADAPEIVVSADSVILDACERWCNVARTVIREHVPAAWMLDFSLLGLAPQE